MSFFISPAGFREAELAARRRLGVPSVRDAAHLALADAPPSFSGRFAPVARAAARRLERLAARLERLQGASARHAVSPAARR